MRVSLRGKHWDRAWVPLVRGSAVRGALVTRMVFFFVFKWETGETKVPSTQPTGTTQHHATLRVCQAMTRPSPLRAHTQPQLSFTNLVSRSRTSMRPTHTTQSERRTTDERSTAATLSPRVVGVGALAANDGERNWRRPGTHTRHEVFVRRMRSHCSRGREGIATGL